MTLVAALQGRDGLVMAADSRGTVGDPRGLTAINDTQTKLLQLTRFVGVAIAGSSELAAQLVVETRRVLAEQPSVVYVDDVLNVVRGLLVSRWNEWFGNMAPEARPVVMFLMSGVGVDSECKIYVLDSRINFAPQLFRNGHALVGVPQYATYLLHRLYDKNMARENLISLAAYVISETATQDPKVGGPIRMAEIDPEHGYLEVPESRIKEIIERNEEQNRRLREFFFGR